MYNALRNSISNKTELKDFMIFDEKEPVVWFQWWEVIRNV